MKNIEKNSQESLVDSLTTSVFIDTDDLNEQSFTEANKKLKHKMLTFFLPSVAVFIALFSLKEKSNYDYILFFVILIYSTILYYLIYKNSLLKLKFYFLSKDKK